MLHHVSIEVAPEHVEERHRELWGQPRAFVTMPGGHRVELMAAPPEMHRVEFGSA